MVVEFDKCLDVVMHAWYAWKVPPKDNGVHDGNMGGVRTSQNSGSVESKDNRVEG